VSDEAYLKIPIVIPGLEKLMATVEEVQASFNEYRGEVNSKLDAIDDVLEGLGSQIENLKAQVAQGQVNAEAVDKLAADLQEARDQLAQVNVSDPSGDNPPS
jgi:ABC-type transporter Mla subunit MlaD